MKQMTNVAVPEYPLLQTEKPGRILYGVDPVPMESPRGYLCRVAHANGYGGPRWLARLAGISHDGLDQEDCARQLACALRMEISEWFQMCYMPVREKGKYDRRSFLGQNIETYQLNVSRPRICPCCLRETSIWWAIWDLALVSVCPIHQCLLISQCPACGKQLIWNRPAVFKCRCGKDFREVTPILAEIDLISINAAIYCAAGFDQHAYWAELKRVNIPMGLNNLSLDEMLNLIRFIGSIQEDSNLRPKLIKFALTKFDDAIKVSVAAASILIDWPQSFKEMLQRMAQMRSKKNGGFGLRDVFGNLPRCLYAVPLRKEFEFLRDKFEEFVVQEWDGLICRPYYEKISSSKLNNSKWITTQEAKKIVHLADEQIHALVRDYQLDGKFVKFGNGKLECWIRLESLNGWIANHLEEMSLYMSQPEAFQVLGLNHFSILTVAQAGLIRYINEFEKVFPIKGIHFFKEDVLKIKHAFEKYSVRIRPYSRPGKFTALRDGIINILGQDVGLPAIIRAVMDGTLHPVGYTKKVPGIRGYLFLSEELRRYNLVGNKIHSEELLKYKDVANILGIDMTTMSALVSNGILTISYNLQTKTEKYIPAAEMLRFANKYVSSSMLAKQFSSSVRWVNRHLWKSRVPMLDVSASHKQRKVFILREIAEKLIIPRGPIPPNDGRSANILFRIGSQSIIDALTH